LTPDELVVVDTDVFSGVLMESMPTGDYTRFTTLLHGQRLALAAQTVAQVRAGALQRNCATGGHGEWQTWKRSYDAFVFSRLMTKCADLGLS